MDSWYLFKGFSKQGEIWLEITVSVTLALRVKHILLKHLDYGRVLQQILPNRN